MIELTEAESRLRNEIVGFRKTAEGFPSGPDRFRAEQIGAKQQALTESLIDRDAIPHRRLKWLVDPEFKIGSSKPRWEVLLGNAGGSPEKVYEHANWHQRGSLPFLLGVIKLPDRIVEEFRAEARNENAYHLGAKFRRIAKAQGLQKSCADDFLKLAGDCELESGDCRSIRDAISKHLR